MAYALERNPGLQDYRSILARPEETARYYHTDYRYEASQPAASDSPLTYSPAQDIIFQQLVPPLSTSNVTMAYSCHDPYSSSQQQMHVHKPSSVMSYRPVPEPRQTGTSHGGERYQPMSRGSSILSGGVRVDERFGSTHNAFRHTDARP